MVWTTYKERVKRLSQRLVEVQRPIRILDSIKWDPSILEDFKKHKYKHLPKVSADYYQKNSLGFDIDKKRDEIKELILDIDSTMGSEDALGQLLSTIAKEYGSVVDMLEMRGTKGFFDHSKILYGSPKDLFLDEKNTVLDLGQMLYGVLNGNSHERLAQKEPERYDAPQVVDLLSKRFEQYFKDHHVEVKLSDGIVADASAGGETVKIRQGKQFTQRDVDILEVHEGWVHVGTTQNGHLQTVAKWLSKGPPRCASTQEGLAVMMEIFTFRSSLSRARRINDRILAIDKAIDGANFLDVFEFYRTEGYSEEDCLSNAKRVFRGGVVEGGAPFTKDLSYCKGFVENFNFMGAAIRAGKPYLIPFLFAGKVKTDDIPLLYQKYKEGLVEAPHYIPHPFQDLNGISVWMGFSTFLNMIDLNKIQEHYNRLFRLHG